MERPWKSRKHPLFVLLIFTGILTTVVFSYAASTIAKGVKESVKIHWIPYYTITLSIVSIIYITLSIALFNALPLRKVSCCSMFTLTTLFLGVAWTLSTVAQIFEEPNNKLYSPTDSKPPMLKIRAILSGAVAIAMFSLAFLSSLHHTLNDPTPGEKDSPSQLESSIGSRSHTQSSTSQRHRSREPTPLPSFHFEPISYPGPAELDSHPVETPGSVRGGNTEKGQGDGTVLVPDSPRR